MRATARLPPRISRATDWIGNDADAKARRDHRLDDLDVLGFGDDARLDVGADEELVDHASRVGAALEQDERLPHERGGGDGPAVGEPVAGRHARSSNSSRITGTVASAESSMGSVSRPRSAAPDAQLAHQPRRAAGDRP